MAVPAGVMCRWPSPFVYILLYFYMVFILKDAVIEIKRNKSGIKTEQMLST